MRELVTLASIVEKETGKPEERPLVAAVYSNRLRIGMGLQCDPTVIYALERAGRFDGNLTREDLRFDSPYNTYRYAGLPPGPIAAPGRAVARGRARPRTFRTSTSSAATTGPTRSRRRSPSTTATSSSIRSSRFGADRHAAAITVREGLGTLRKCTLLRVVVTLAG